MNHKILKVFSLLLALTLLVVSSGISAVAADIQLPENSDISKLGIQSKIEGNTVTVNLVAVQELYLFMLEGTYVAPAGFTLTGVTSTVLPNFATGNNYVKDGKVVYVDFDVNPDEDAAYAAGTVLMTATYTVAEGTAAGDYTFAFNCTAFLEFADEPFMGSYEIEAEVHLCKDVATDKDHICDANGCDKVLSECNDVFKGYENLGENHRAVYQCEICKRDRYVAGSHDFTNGNCICGAKKPGLKGDVNLDGEVDMLDFSALARHVGEVEYIADSQALSNADINRDGSVDMSDFSALARHVGEVEFITD